MDDPTAMHIWRALIGFSGMCILKKKEMWNWEADVKGVSEGCWWEGGG